MSVRWIEFKRVPNGGPVIVRADQVVAVRMIDEITSNIYLTNGDPITVSTPYADAKNDLGIHGHGTGTTSS